MHGYLTQAKKLLRSALLDYEKGNERVVQPPHYQHCLDALRQDLMCQADDIPMPGLPGAHMIGRGQVRQCRDWNQLIEWTQQPDFEACYYNFGDYRPIYHGIEHYAYCSKDSKYFDIMSAYFERHGHHDPFVE